MSRFLSRAAASITPYVPGEQPRDRRYIKLNTNECPYPPSPEVAKAISAFESGDLRLYPDPDSADFTAELAALHGLRPEQALACGGSDEALAFAFMTFCDRGSNVYFPDITYGFYRVYADLFALRAVEIPLREDFTVAVEDYFDKDGVIFLANPNAPTGIALQPAQIEEILRRNPEHVVVVDEAYADFAPGCSCVGLIDRYENLLVVQTFSKSRAMAGMRLAAAYGNAALIEGMNRVRYSFNPYNLDRVSLAAGIACVRDRAYTESLVRRVVATREKTATRLRELGFTVLPSSANFLFVRGPALSGEKLYTLLREQGILVRHFSKPRIQDFVRVTMGTDEEMEALFQVLEALR